MTRADDELVKQIGDKGYFGRITVEPEPLGTDGEITVEFEPSVPKRWQPGSVIWHPLRA